MTWWPPPFFGFLVGVPHYKQAYSAMQTRVTPVMQAREKGVGAGTHDLAASGAGSSVSGRSAAGAQTAALQVSGVLVAQVVSTLGACGSGMLQADHSSGSACGLGARCSSSDAMHTHYRAT